MLSPRVRCRPLSSRAVGGAGVCRAASRCACCTRSTSSAPTVHLLRHGDLRRARAADGRRASADPVRRDPPARVCVAARFPFFPRRLAGARHQPAAGRELPGAAHARPARRGGLRAADGATSRSCSRSLYFPFIEYGALFLSEIHFIFWMTLAFAAVPAARGAPGAARVALGLAVGGRPRAVGRHRSQVRGAARRVRLLRRRGRRAAGRAPGATVRAPCPGAARLARAQAVAAARRAGRASRRRRCSACSRASARARTTAGSASRATRWAPTSCSATTGASRTSNGSTEGHDQFRFGSPGALLRHYDAHAQGAIFDHGQRRQHGRGVALDRQAPGRGDRAVARSHLRHVLRLVDVAEVQQRDVAVRKSVPVHLHRAALRADRARLRRHREARLARAL